jgi:protein involved in polysaccharide export with SLBB domain
MESMMDRQLVQRRHAQCVSWAGRGHWAASILLLLSGCYAPLFSNGTPARKLPDEYRIPFRTSGVPINYASLTQSPPADYRLSAGDVLEVTIPDLFRDAVAHPLRVQVMGSGEVQLPKLGPVQVGEMNLLEAQNAIIKAYRAGDVLVSPSINVALAQKATIPVVVLGSVLNPGVYPLAKYENDVGHALAAAGGFNDDADEKIEVHRRIRIEPTLPTPPNAMRAPAPFVPQTPPGSMAEAALRISEATQPSAVQPAMALLPSGSWPRLRHRHHGHVPPAGMIGSTAVEAYIDDSMQMFTIPLRGHGAEVSPADVLLQPGDVIVVPSRRHEVFFVVGKLAQQNFVRFTVRERERELGGGFLLPKERDIDVVTAVAMAGFIDPIDSPTTVTVHRTTPDGHPLLIHVDLIKARYDRRETVMVQAGDIIYLNPDCHWWCRRTFDRIVADLILIPYNAATFNRWILPPRGR